MQVKKNQPDLARSEFGIYKIIEFNGGYKYHLENNVKRQMELNVRLFMSNCTFTENTLDDKRYT